MKINQDVNERIESKPVVVEQVYNAPTSKVWQAITDLKQMRQWFFNTLGSFKAEVGFETRFDVVNANIIYPHLWRVTEVVHGKMMTISWKYEGYSGDSYVTFELFPEKNQTRLRLTHTGIETFPQNNPDFSRESCTHGWKYIISKNLKEFLEK